MKLHRRLIARPFSRFRTFNTEALATPGPVLLVLVAFAAFQAGCVQLAEVDSTHSPVYASILGREFELKEEFLILGVKLQYPSAELDYIKILPPPGPAPTRFVSDLGRMPAGSRFRIVDVVTRESKIFPSTEYVIAFANHPVAGAKGKPIRLCDTPAWRLYVKPASAGEAPQLSEKYFRPLEGTPR